MDILGASSMELDPQVRLVAGYVLRFCCGLPRGNACTWQKLDEASDLDINTLELWLTAQKMFKVIMQSEKSLPQELRLLIRRIHDDVRLCLPWYPDCWRGSQMRARTNRWRRSSATRPCSGPWADSSSFASSARHFLRPSCTAFSTSRLTPYLPLPARMTSCSLTKYCWPHQRVGAGLWWWVQMAQRQLILVTKVLQNLANDTLPGAKEVSDLQYCPRSTKLIERYCSYTGIHGAAQRVHRVQ
jgi:hypothetical protein